MYGDTFTIDCIGELFEGVKVDANTIRDMIVSAAVAAFAAVMLLLYEPKKDRPEFWSGVGRVGIAIVAALLVSAFSTDVFKLSPKMTFALSGAAGVFGIRIYVALARYGKKFGINLDDAKDEEWSHRDDSRTALKENETKDTIKNTKGVPNGDDETLVTKKGKGENREPNEER